MRNHHSLALILLLSAACDRDPGTGGNAGDLSFAGDMQEVPFTSYDLSCVGVTIAAHLVPVSLVFMLDRSGSMGDGVNGDPTLKWDPVTAALKAFFEDPSSVGVSASLQYFSLPNSNDICNLSGYYTPAVSMRSLPDLSFGASMSSIMPMGSTPTLPAMEGALMYAQDTLDANPGSRVAAVLVTDGDPDVCDSSVNDVALQLSMFEPKVTTYVLGVGTNLPNLNQLAVAGGTGSPTLVTVGNPDDTKTQFLAALDAIRGLVLTCDFAIPAPPKGMTIDFTQVNVTFTPSSTMVPELIPYDKDCTSPTAGWRYDDPNNPTQVQLCPPTCDAAKADRDGVINTLFGCTTVGNLVS
jgi:hypothetical protein